MNKPSEEIAEVSLIGTGGGYGESIVIHMGFNNWIVVDSCIDPYTKNNLPIEYLENLGVQIEEDVKLIICTHWHDDHIQGISKLLERSSNAKFCMGHVSDRKKFLQLLMLDYKKVESQSSISSTLELNKCLKILRSRNNQISRAFQDRTLKKVQRGNIASEILSLSPSDYVINEFDNEIFTMINDYGSNNRKILYQSPNDKSVALYLKLNKHRVLLGSDLEVSENREKGWINILDNSQVIDNKCSLFKIPHHGSINGYDPRIWDELICDKSISKLTPWNRGNKLPTNEMLSFYQSCNNRLFMTPMQKKSNSPKKRNKSLKKAIYKFNPTLTEIKYNRGIIRSRVSLIEENPNWHIDLYDAAFEVTNEYIENLNN